MERKYIVFAAMVGVIYGGLFLLFLALENIFLAQPIAPIYHIILVFLLTGLTVVAFKHKMSGKLLDTLIAGGIAGGIIGISVFSGLMIMSTISDLRIHGMYTSSNSGWFLIAYVWILFGIVAMAVCSIVGAIATGFAFIGLKLYRSIRQDKE